MMIRPAPARACRVVTPACIAFRRLSTRATRAQDVLDAHPAIARAVAISKGETVNAVIMPQHGALYTPWHGMHGNAAGKRQDDTLIDWINKLLRKKELISSVHIVSREDALPTLITREVTSPTSVRPPKGKS